MPKQQFEIIRHSLVDSTHHLAIDLGLKGAAHGTVVLAHEQSGGRGRQSRCFFSPPGGLYISVILRPKLQVDNLSLITLAAGVACAEAIEMITDNPVSLKWPNDLLSNTKKLGGILTEAAPYSPVAKEVPFVVVGIGVNVNTRHETFPEPLQDQATSLYCLTGQQYDIETLLQCIVHSLLKEIALLQDYPRQVLAHWREKDTLLGKDIRWRNPEGSVVHGTGNGLLDDGRYHLTALDGEDYFVLAGDISITDINGLSIR